MSRTRRHISESVQPKAPPRAGKGSRPEGRSIRPMWAGAAQSSMACVTRIEEPTMHSDLSIHLAAARASDIARAESTRERAAAGPRAGARTGTVRAWARMRRLQARGA
jgi:hypothetical protein